LKAIFQGGALGGEDENSEIWKVIMSEVDSNNDGEISYEEFYDQMMKVIQKKTT
jgi:Ca2+-binding EF-hand superfamily protein